MTAEFEIKDILIVLKLMSDNNISNVELQFTKEGILVVQGTNKHVIRSHIKPCSIINNNITNSLIDEFYKNNIPKRINFINKLKIKLLGD
jgi:hypothetical protein